MMGVRVNVRENARKPKKKGGPIESDATVPVHALLDGSDEDRAEQSAGALSDGHGP
jgi:hypothetical protein